MGALHHFFNMATLLDGLAIVCSLILILFLLMNRRKYGRFVLNAAHSRSHMEFADQVTLHMLTQQSQKAYTNLQQALAKEFESLRLMGADHVSDRPNDKPYHFSMPAANADPDRRQRYRMAGEMMSRGKDARHISQACGLMEGELELLRSLQQFGEDRIHADHSVTKATVTA
jgi:hypothetical protein